MNSNQPSAHNPPQPVISYFNRPPSIDPQDNEFTRYFDLSKWGKDLHIVFPFRNVKNLDNPLDRYFYWNFGPRENEIRISYCPKPVPTTPALFNTGDLFAGHVDITLGQETQKRYPYASYYRLPRWALELFGFCPTLAEIESKIAQLEAKRQANPFLRTKFMACVANRDEYLYLRGVRRMIIEQLADDPQLGQLPIQCAGRLLHNDDSLQQYFDDQLVPYLEQFTFNICTESINQLAIVTEKLAHCLEAGCIPVYWGDLSEEANIFNRKAMVEFDVTRRWELAARLKSILCNQEQFLAEPIFLPDAAQHIYNQIYLPIISRLEELLGNIDLYATRRDASPAHVLNQPTTQAEDIPHQGNFLARFGRTIKDIVAQIFGHADSGQK